MTRSIGLSVLVLFLAATAVGFTYDARAAEPLRVEATVSDVPGREALVFTITNASQEPVEIDESALPWGNRYGVLMVAVLKRTQKSVPAGYPVDDAFVDKSVKIQPGRQVRGTVFLAEHFGDLADSRRKDDLLVFWYFEPEGQRRESLGRYGGWVLLGKATEK